MRFSAFLIPLFLTALSCSNNEQSQKEEQKTSTDTDQRLAKNYFIDCKKLFTDARQIDSILLKQNEIDPKSAKQAIEAFTAFAYYCVSDTLSPVFLIKTAQVAKSINNIPQAKLVLDKCIADYPSFNNRVAAIFLLAQLYDEPSYLNNENEAKKLYQQIIDEYPESDWAQSAKGAINFIGKSDEEIMKEILQKKK